MFPTPGRLWIDGIGIEDATSDLAQLAQWADELSGFNWSVATGHESGVFALEATEPYGLRSLRELSQLDWPETLYSSSSNYLIAFFRYPNRRRAIGAGKIEIAPGIIVRTDGESVVIPPPHDPERWPVSDEAVLESPEWLSECVFASIEPDPAIQETRRFTLIRGGLYGRTTQK